MNTFPSANMTFSTPFYYINYNVGHLRPDTIIFFVHKIHRDIIVQSATEVRGGSSIGVSLLVLE